MVFVPWFHSSRCLSVVGSPYSCSASVGHYAPDRQTDTFFLCILIVRVPVCFLFVLFRKQDLLSFFREDQPSTTQLLNELPGLVLATANGSSQVPVVDAWVPGIQRLLQFQRKL